VAAFWAPIIDPDTGQKTQSLFRGGPEPGREHLRYADLHATIAPYSMEYVEDAVLQRRVQTAIAGVVQVLDASVAHPELKTRRIINDLMESINIRDGGARYVDFAVLEQQRALRGMGLLGADGLPTPPQGAANPGAMAQEGSGVSAGMAGAGSPESASASAEYAAVLAEAASQL